MFSDEDESLSAESEIERTPEVVNFYFPVEVVVIGALREADRTILEAGIWERLHDAIERTA